MKKLAKIYEYFIYVLPAVLFFSYFPIIAIGSNESMNFELSLPLIWLVLFDVLAAVLLFAKIKFGKKYPGITDRKFFAFSWLPLFATASIFWSLNPTRGILTAGILWLVFFAIFALIFLTKYFVEDFNKEKLIKSFLISSCVICVWCFVQCILDVLNVGRDATLLCRGCTVQSFGFPHPNGFSIEPQFMGNLLLAPTLYMLYEFIKKRNLKNTLLLGLFAATLFLTFSRGAIYAFAAATVFMLIFEIIKQKKATPLKSLMVLIVAFLFTLNLQGIFAAVSRTNDTYLSGVNKVVSQLSLGIIDFHVTSNEMPENESTSPETSDYDGYVTESTEIRLMLSKAAGKIWQENKAVTIRGVGLGGAGMALYNHGDTGSTKEIVQNEYFSILLELGLIGFAFFLIACVLIVRAFKNNPARILFYALFIAYGVTLCFFAGLPNALQIYLSPALLVLIMSEQEPKKLKK
ncbi:O-antigen ligase family protein [Candidatus Saccharibacteria bacterium]|nr:O-antigen ligase family protein [Candidatus Saccharibacteria bacterium]